MIYCLQEKTDKREIILNYRIQSLVKIDTLGGNEQKKKTRSTVFMEELVDERNS